MVTSKEELLTRLDNEIARLENGEDHDEGAFDPGCEVCMAVALLRECAAALRSQAGTKATEGAIPSNEILKLADEYEAGLRKMEVAGYEEFEPAMHKHRIVIAALRSQAGSETSSGVCNCDDAFDEPSKIAKCPIHGDPPSPSAHGAEVVEKAYRLFPDEVETVDYHPAGKITVDRGDLRYAFLVGVDYAAPSQPGIELREALENLRTHREAWRVAIVRTLGNSLPATVDDDDKAYWRHELRAFDRTFAALAKATESDSQSKLWSALSHAANRYLDREDAEEFMQFIKDYIK